MAGTQTHQKVMNPTQLPHIKQRGSNITCQGTILPVRCYKTEIPVT